MSCTRTISLALSVLAVSASLFWAAGCRSEATNQLAAKNTTATATSTPKSADSDEAEIQAERAKLSPEERKLVEAQEWCVVNKGRLGSMGAPIKLVVKDQPVFICCAGCEKKALADPDVTLAKVEALKAKAKEANSKK